MEARDSGSKIRPLPVDDLDVDAPQHEPTEPKRRWVPLIVIAAGAAAFGVIATGLRPAGPDEVGDRSAAPPATIAAEATSTTMATIPEPVPTLRELLPFAEDGLRLIALSATSARAGEWLPEAAAPVYSANITQPKFAAFNADGTRVAVLVATSGDNAIVINDATSGNPTYLRGANRGFWHPADPNLFAWSEVADNRQSTTIRVGDLSGYVSAGLDPLFEFTVEGEHSLQAWGDWGFATGMGGITFAFDSDGIETRSAAGTLFDASAEGVLLIRATSPENSIPVLVYPDGSIVDLPTLDVGASDYRITQDGTWVLAITLQADDHTSILAKAINSRSTRLTSIEQAARIVGSMANDRVLILQEVQSKDLVFKDWNTGAEFRVPIGTELGAVFLEEGSL